MARGHDYALFFRFGPIEDEKALENIQEWLQDYRTSLIRRLDYEFENMGRRNQLEGSRFKIKGEKVGMYIFSYSGEPLSREEKRAIGRVICKYIDNDLNPEFKAFATRRLGLEISYRELFNPDESSIEEI